MKLTALQQKMIMVALDPGIPDGEVDAAAGAFIKALRKEYRDGHQFLQALSKGSGASLSPAPREGVNYGDVELTFGKYKGKRIKEVDAGWVMKALDTTLPHRIDKYVRIAMQRYLRDEKYRD
jgi:hypothetical protein